MKIPALIIGLFLTITLTAQQHVSTQRDASGNTKALYITDKGITKAIYYHENGKISETGYMKGRYNHGNWKRWDENGNLIANAHFDEGQKIGKWEFWNSNGEVIKTLKYSNNKLVGYFDNSMAYND